ncbi:MAG: hypothetical protein MZV64_62950 [Ignavibacteriales bacterium]|nr:hypothetical protein [Ignavibacteriales bacterium]
MGRSRSTTYSIKRSTTCQDAVTKEDWQKVISELQKENQRLANDRATPSNLEAREKLLTMLLHEAKTFPDDFPDLSTIQDDYDKLMMLRKKLQHAQEKFFEDREHVLQEAASLGYEIFDSPQLSVAISPYLKSSEI